MKKRTEELVNELKNCESITSYIEENQTEFWEIDLAEYIEILMKDKSLKKIDIVKRSRLSEVYTYQILAGMRNPDRDKLLCIIFAMELTRSEADRLLKIAGKSGLYAKNKRDSILIFALDRRLPLEDTNDMLYELGEQTLY